MIAALFVEPRGEYSKFPGVDLWDQSRDARLYSGPHPVVAHPPCGRWCQLARLNESRWGATVGDDGGCFAAALAAVQRWGGVLEHPAYSLAWARFGLSEPPKRGWQQSIDGSWVCEVSQAAYGCEARKLTWLYYVGAAPPAAALWTRPRASKAVSYCRNHGSEGMPRMNKREASATPPAFAEFLISLARQSQVRRAA